MRPVLHEPVLRALALLEQFKAHARPIGLRRDGDYDIALGGRLHEFDAHVLERELQVSNLNGPCALDRAVHESGQSTATGCPAGRVETRLTCSVPASTRFGLMLSSMSLAPVRRHHGTSSSMCVLRTDQMRPFREAPTVTFQFPLRFPCQPSPT